MTVTDQIKVLNRKIKQNEAQYDLDRKAAKISALSSNNLDKYEYLTGKDLNLKPSTVEKAKFKYSPLGILLSKAFKSVTKNKSDFNYVSNHTFFRFSKGYDEFEKRSLDSKYNNMKEFNKLLISFKNLKTKKTETQLKKERIMKNVYKLYKNYYNAYKSNFDTNDESTEDKKKKFNYKQFKIDNTISKESKLDEKTKELKLTELPKWIKVSEKRFNEILSRTTKAKNNGFKINVDGNEITLDKAESLLEDVGSRKIDGHEFKEKYNSIVDDVEKILNKETLTKNQAKMIEILLLLKEIIKPNDKKKQMNNQTLQICRN